MADKKISALTGAATPLGGTEVLPIVQSGNTVKVSVADLTTGRSVAASELTTTGNILAGATSNAANCRVLAENGTGQQLGARYAGVATHYLSVESNGDLNFNRDNTEFARFVNSNTNFALKTGNLVISTANKGIDFSANANAPGMTSELLDWYEEGTWTPSVGGNATYYGQVGNYTRVGNKVYVSGSIIINVLGTGSASIISGLPFAATNAPAGFIGFSNFANLALAVTFITGYADGASTITILSSLIAATSLSSNNVIGDSTRLDFAGTYLV